ncbi:hypothetical protein [Flavobacterium fluviale]|uniref:Uncharacterized protein n=1 Tax=Flavobacterium fluviale TaxID=2249356 RepID=A0A344LQI8_9FLAO|nr:hypothetical protein [Flavobacterium fluviale]AXB56180.1 hypothetical protein HYN86_06025 [Flavobacterium fluviale]
MIKYLKYISITVIAFALFSCKKNEWTPEKEAEFKKGVKERLEKGSFNENQINYIANCTFEKVKSKDLKPNDYEKPQTLEVVKNMEKECSNESYEKSLTREDIARVWNPEIIRSYKKILKPIFIQKGFKDDQASYIADCTAYTLFQQNVTIADLQDPRYQNLIERVGMFCQQELIRQN